MADRALAILEQEAAPPPPVPRGTGFVLLVNCTGRPIRIGTRLGRPGLATVAGVAAALVANYQAVHHADEPPLFRVHVGAAYLGPGNIAVELGGEEGIAREHSNFLMQREVGPGDAVADDELVVLLGTTSGSEMQVALLGDPSAIYEDLCYVAWRTGLALACVVGVATVCIIRRP